MFQYPETLILWNGFLLMRAVMKHKWDAHIPTLFQKDVHQPSLVGTVVPTRQVRSTVGSFWRRFNLYPIDTSCTSESEMINWSKFVINIWSTKFIFCFDISVYLPMYLSIYYITVASKSSGTEVNTVILRLVGWSLIMHVETYTPSTHSRVVQSLLL
jgi:hypothetical protein